MWQRGQYERYRPLVRVPGAWTITTKFPNVLSELPWYRSHVENVQALHTPLGHGGEWGEWLHQGVAASPTFLDQQLLMILTELDIEFS